MEGDDAPPPQRLPANFDAGFRAHNTNVYPERPDRCYLGYIDGGIMVLDISDQSRPKLVSRWANSPPYNGFNHTVLPLFDRGLLVVSDESVQDNAADWPKLVWILDARDERHLVSIATLPLPPVDAFKQRGGRFGAHNLHENPPVPGAWRRTTSSSAPSSTAACAPTTSRTRTRRARSPTSCRRRPRARRIGAVQINDVFVDDRGIVFTVDRHNGGLYALEMNV